MQRTPPNRTPPASSYGPLCAAFYDADKPNASDEEIAWYDARLPRDAGPVLDVMCGSGRLLAPLVERGHNLHGVDASAAMLARCEQRLDAAGCRAMLFRQDVATLNLPFRYAAAFVAAGSFQRGERGTGRERRPRQLRIRVGLGDHRGHDFGAGGGLDRGDPRVDGFTLARAQHRAALHHSAQAM